MIGNKLPLNTSYGPQLLFGLFLGVWLYLFLVLIGPFDAAEVPLSIRTFLMIGYSLVFFLAYALLVVVQNKLYQYLGKWTIGWECFIVLLFCVYSLPLCFAYYKTDIVRGDFNFDKFTFSIYLPTLAILLPVIFLGRHLLVRNKKEKRSEENAIASVTLLGENKLDILKLPIANLIAIEAANNYVVVYYLLGGNLQKKLLRSSLSKIHQTVPQMVKVHRSYLVNWEHFIAWQDGTTLLLTQTTVPVSQKYKPTLLAMS